MAGDLFIEVSVCVSVCNCKKFRSTECLWLAVLEKKKSIKVLLDHPKQKFFFDDQGHL